jgi:magnesium chelatase family protein
MAFNPCPCGWLGARHRQCRCDNGQARRYAARLSGPLRDRLDLWVNADPPRRRGWDGAEPSANVARRVAEAWRAQRERQGMLNGELPAADTERRIGLASDVTSLMVTRSEQLLLSPRRVHRALRVARTIADLAGSEAVRREHVDEALHYRPEAVA